MFHGSSRSWSFRAHFATAKRTTAARARRVLRLGALLLLVGAAHGMITPIFSVTQDHATVTVTMRTPYIKADELEIDVSGSAFKCHVRPYYLSLNFKQPLQEGGEQARWDVDSNEMTVVIPKATPGEHFDNLEMLTELLTQPKRSAVPPVGANGIEVIEERFAAGEEESEDEGDFDWEIPQKMPALDAGEELLNRSTYGFNNRHQGVFASRQDYETDIIDLKNADSVPASQRRALRVAQEDAKFVEEHEHYLCDTLGAEEPLPSLISFVCPWQASAAAKSAVAKKARDGGGRETNDARVAAAVRAVVCGGAGGGAVEVSEEREIDFAAIDKGSGALGVDEEEGWGGGLMAEEREALLKLPRRQFILTKDDKKRALIGLVDILYGFAYDMRATMCEGTCESAWTICKLSPVYVCVCLRVCECMYVYVCVCVNVCMCMSASV